MGCSRGCTIAFLGKIFLGGLPSKYCLASNWAVLYHTTDTFIVLYSLLTSMEEIFNRTVTSDRNSTAQEHLHTNW